jgi:hypothetical protein
MPGWQCWVLAMNANLGGNGEFRKMPLWMAREFGLRVHRQCGGSMIHVEQEVLIGLYKPKDRPNVACHGRMIGLSTAVRLVRPSFKSNLNGGVPP